MGRWCASERCTESDYYRTVQNEPAIDRRFEPIRVVDLTAEGTTEVLRAVLPTLAGNADDYPQDDVLRAVVKLAGRYLPQSPLP